ncbi:MAG: hypothetical protein AB8C95_14835, partial [Phycisphaeraceae bacterium]
MLKSHRKGRFSGEYLLTDEDQPCGRFKRSLWQVHTDVWLLDRYRLRYQRASGIIRAHFELIDLQEQKTQIASGKRKRLSEDWELSLSIGDCLMVPGGVDRQGFNVQH